MATPESKVKQRVCDILKAAGAWHSMPVTSGYGRSGLPDILACVNGRFFAIECKAGKNTTTALQDRELQRIRFSGGVALVINEGNIHELEEEIRRH